MQLIPMFHIETLAVDEKTVEQQSTDEQAEVTEEISREYEIKEEETWDISENGDGSVIAKWTLSNRTLTISGMGKMKDWTFSTETDWHDTQYQMVIENVIIDEGVTNISRRAFFNCENLINVNIPDSVINIYAEVFSGCINLLEIEIPSNIKKISNRLFTNCSSLEHINIPDKIEEIENEAFNGCSSLKSINIPSSVTSVKFGAFEDCTSLESINVDENNKVYMSDSGILFNKEKTEIIKYPEGKKDINHYVIPNGVENIYTEAFYNSMHLTNITIPNSVKTIDNRAFYSCKSLTSVEIPSSVQIIKSSTFEMCLNLSDVIIPSGITSIESGAFSNCKNLKNINIPNTVVDLGQRIFTNCKKLILNVEADSMLHQYAEENKCAYFLEGIASSISTDYEIKKEEKWDISKSEKDNVIATWTLQNKTLTISGTGEMQDKEINIDQYWHNNKYENIIEKVIINEGVTNIGREEFEKCGNLKTISISNTVSNIGKFAFNDCDSLQVINVSDSNNNYISVDGILFNKDKSKIIKYPAGKDDIKEYILPTTVISIGEYCFSNNKNLTNIELSNNIKSILDSAFRGVVNLENISMTDNVTYIGYYAFYNCANLKEINIPKTITEINEHTFSECKSLTYVNIPNGVTSINGSAFSGCSRLENINIQSSVTKIGEYAFSDCTSLKNVIITESIEVIEHRAFDNCNKMINIIIPETVIEIRDRGIDENIVMYVTENSEAHRYAEESRHAYIIDKKSPTANIIYTPSNLTNQNVTVTIVPNEQIREVEGWILSKDKAKLTKVFSSNGSETVKIKDIVGYETQVEIEVTNIDKIGPTVNVSYSTKNPTNGNVAVTITSNEEVQEVSGWTLSSDKLKLTKTYSQNTNEAVTIKDLAGNTKEATVQITNIDKTAPTVNVTYSTKNSTNQNVTVTITSNEQMQAVSGWTLSSDKLKLTKTYSQNTNEIVTVKDLVGNEAQANIEINNIDKVGPDIQVEYSSKEITKENVTVTITSNEEIQEVEGWTLSSDKKVLIKEYAENTKETITIKDLAGNEAQANIEITNIDKTLPEITIGDINQDKIIDITDMFLLKRHMIAGSIESWRLKGDSLIAADMDKNGVVDITDYLLLKRLLVQN